MNIRVSAPYKKVCARIQLSGSKSESNRVLIIAALTKEKFSIHDLAAARDTQTLIEILSSIRGVVPQAEQVYDVGPAGTAMRFLTAFLANCQGRFLLTGSERMKQRPIGILVEALQQLGAEISYQGQHGYPPLHIVGGKLRGGKIEMNPSVSSQFISAMLLIAPTLRGGLEIHFSGDPVSRPYVNMTMDLMRYFGAEVNWEGNTIRVEEGAYEPLDFCVEADWSAASYWYELAALADDAELFLGGLQKVSLQGDSVLPQLFESFGVQTDFEEDGVRIFRKKDFRKKAVFIYDFEACPDIAQTVACTCAALGIEARLKGLKTLRIKETDRLLALKNELKKFGCLVELIGEDEMHIQSGSLQRPAEPICTYEDHRMAMAFAPLAMRVGEIEIENRKVVDKSYPAYWADLAHAGFELN